MNRLHLWTDIVRSYLGLCCLLAMVTLASAHVGREQRLAAINRHLLTTPHDADALYRRAEFHRQDHDLDAALEDLGRALALRRPNSTEALVAARVFRAAGDPLRALETADPFRTDPRHRLVMARAHVDLGNCEAALRSYRMLASSASPEVRGESRDVEAACGHRVHTNHEPIPEPTSSTPGANPTLTRGPYLQMGTETSVVVRWRTDVPTTSRVEYGPAVGNLSEATMVPGTRTEHEVPLAGLTPDSSVFYAVHGSAGILAGNDADHWFRTAPADGSPRPSRIWILGDSGTADVTAMQVRDAYYAYTGSTHTDLWLMLGDNAYPDGTDAEYQAAVFDMFPTMLRRSVLWPTPGNHDSYSSSALTQSGPYYEMFTLPTNAEAGGFASGTEAYYSFDFGNLHFISLESHESDTSLGGPMMTWLAADLAQNSSQWVIAFWHHPPYSKGSHDSDAESLLYNMRENALPILEAHGVDLVFTGHSHAYERSFLIDGHYGYSWTLADSMVLDGGNGRISSGGAYKKPLAGGTPHAGTVYVVAGASGKVGSGTFDHPVMYMSQALLGSAVLDVDGDQVIVRYLNINGQVADAFTVQRTDNAVGVRWGDASSYIVSANPNPGPQTQIRYQLAARSRAQFHIYDVRGRRVRTLRARAGEAGAHLIAWDGRDAHGRRVAQGVYVVEMRAGASVDRIKVTLMH